MTMHPVTSPVSRSASRRAWGRHGSAGAFPGLSYWRREPPDQATVEGCYGIGQDDWLPLPELIESFGRLGCDVVELVLADQDSWDRYEAAKWLNIRRWLDANPHDELAGEMRAELDTAPARHVRYQREYLGWGVFVLMNR